MVLLAALGLLFAAPDVSGTYRIETTKVVKVKKGETGHAKVEVVPRSDAHVSPDAPISLAVTSGPTLTLAKQKLGRPDARSTQAKGVEFDIPFTAAAAGTDEVKGTLSFFICTEKLCERQTQQIATAVEVR
jgi:hypothetical protein